MRLLTITSLLLFAACGAFAQGSVTIDHIEGLADSGIIMSSQPIVFHMRFTNDSGRAMAGSANGFRIYSPDGAKWAPVTADTTGAITSAMYDLGVFINTFGITGSGMDTICIGGATLKGTGIPAGFDEIVMKINTRVDKVYDGKTLCIDTSWYPPMGRWMWSMTTEQPILPAWNGPYCFSVKAVEPADSTAGE